MADLWVLIALLAIGIFSSLAALALIVTAWERRSYRRAIQAARTLTSEIHAYKPVLRAVIASYPVFPL